ncbi:plasmid stabilization protein [Halobacteriales archaeon QS_4_69_34]|nr:MAG: plasmid stabilization protein [Halobacteriales archaeon QS_4_69_34]
MTDVPRDPVAFRRTGAVISRRTILRAGTAAAGAAAGLSGCLGGGGDSGDGGGGGSSTTDGNEATVEAGPDGEFAFRPGTDEPLTAASGATVRFVWRSAGHNVHVDSQPDGADWSGHETIENEGFEFSHTFETPGEYRYWCQPHKSNGMIADIVIEE